MVEYDPVKERIARAVRRGTAGRKIVFRILDTIFLRTWYVKRAVKRTVPRQGSDMGILDAGSGFGQYAYFLARQYPRAQVKGVEYKQSLADDCEAFARASNMQNLTFVQGDLLAYEDEPVYDLIICVDVLEHIEDDAGLMKRFSRWMKPGGRVILSTPSLYRKHEHDGSFVGEHFRDGYTREDITEKLNRAGLDIERFEYSYGVFGDIAWRIGIRNTMQLMAKGAAGRIAGSVYFAMVLIPVLLLMAVDYIVLNKQGTGLCVTARKT